jgi:Amt family ammonium transporter
MTRKLTYEELESKVRELRKRIIQQRSNPRSVRDTANRGRQLLDQAPDVIWSADARTLRFTFLSASFAPFSGWRCSDLLWRKIEDSIRPACFSRLTQAIRGAAEESLRRGPEGANPVNRFDIAFLHREGHLVWTETHLSFLCDAGGVNEILGVSRPIVGERLDRKGLEESEERYRTAFESSANAGTIIGEDTTILMVNAAFEKMARQPREEIEGKLSLTAFISEKERARIIQYHVLRRTDMPLVPKTYETEWVDREGKVRPVYIAEALVAHTKKSVVSILDLTQIKEAEEAIVKQRAYFRQLFESSPQAILIVGLDGKIIDVNRGYETLLGYEAAEILGEQEQGISVPEDRLEECQQFQQTMLRGETCQNETRRRRKDGRVLPVAFLGFPIRIRNRVEGYFCVYTDISERKAFEEELHHQAFYDSLTGIANRALFMERLGRALERAKRRMAYAFAVLLVDVDRFKRINDSLGHLFGDRLLVEIAKRFNASVRTVDTVARLGGDEFAILFEEFNHPDEAIDLAGRILNESRQPFAIDGNEVHISASIGVVAETRAYQTSEDILRDADIAMYHAKAMGRSQFRVFDAKMLEQAVESLKREKDLRNAIEKGHFLLYYQPIVCLRTEKIQGFEALVRWKHPKHGIISPEHFIPTAEETGLIARIGHWVIGEACRQMREWHQAIPASQRLHVSVNLSVKEFLQDGLVDHIATVLQAHEVDASCLKLELTESMLMEDSQKAMEKLKRLKELGIKLAIDDFGTGYSSLAYLNKFPIDYLKIDRSFVQGLSAEGDSAEIVRTIITLGHNLNYVIIAEGVENDEQIHHLRELDCDQVQGYFFSEPVDRGAAFRLIKNFS